MSIESLNQNLYKIIVIGNSSVGKSNIIKTFIDKKKPQLIQLTIGVDYYSTYIPIEGGNKIKVEVWDTAGSQQFRSMTYSYYKKAFGILIVFDITNKKSFQDVDFWMDVVKENGQPQAIKCLVGNKMDKYDKRVISRSQAERYAQENKILYAQTSVFDLESIERTFYKLARVIYKQKANWADLQSINLEQPIGQSCRCCRS